MSVQLPRMTWTQKKQIALNNFLKIDEPPNFQLKVADGKLGKLLAGTRLKCETADNIFAEYFVVMKKLTGPNIGLHFMSINSVVLDAKRGHIHFPYSMMQVKTASSETTANSQLFITDDALAIPPKQQKQSQPLLSTRENGTQQGL